MKRYRYKNAAYLIVAQDPIADPLAEEEESPEEGPTEEQLVEEQEKEPGMTWRDRYQQPLIRAIRSLFDLEKGQVKLLGPRKEVPLGSDAYGFDIVGHVRFEDYSPDENRYGKPPYRFKVHVDGEGQMSKRVEIMGRSID